jgi:hypothetical protein
MATLTLGLNLPRLRLNLVCIVWQRRAALIELAMTNDLLCKPRLHFWATSQKNGFNLLHKID